MSGASLAPWRRRLRDSRWLVCFELLCIAAIFVADRYHYIFWSKTPYLLALAWASMALRGVRWRDIGLNIPPHWKRLILWGLLTGIAIEAMELFVTQPLFAALTGKYPNLSDFHPLIGNVKLLLILISLAWIGGGLGEELAWRGYVLNRLTDLFGTSRAGWIAALVVSSATFGFAHDYQDITGVLENTLDGLLLALLYLATGRNLIAPIVAHGLTDTLDFLLIFSGHYPGMH